MMTYIKANLAAIAASLLDYALFFVLVRWIGATASASTAIGMVCGGVLAFFLGRGWAFQATTGDAGGQVLRYALVWLGNIALSALLVGWLAGWLGVRPLIAGRPGINPLIARVGVGVVMGLTYSYFMQRWFVFPKTAAQNGALPRTHASTSGGAPLNARPPGAPGHD